MDPIRFVKQCGVVLESARGPVPNLADAVAGGPIRGSWWKHKKSRAIFRATRDVRDCEEILVCRLIGGKVTYVHRRLWPAIVRLSASLDKKALAAIREEHTPSGAHKLITVSFARWVTPAIRRAAKNISEERAHLQLGDWIKRYQRGGRGGKS